MKVRMVYHVSFLPYAKDTFDVWESCVMLSGVFLLEVSGSDPNLSDFWLLQNIEKTVLKRMWVEIRQDHARTAMYRVNFLNVTVLG